MGKDLDYEGFFKLPEFEKVPQPSDFVLEYSLHAMALSFVICGNIHGSDIKGCFETAKEILGDVGDYIEDNDTRTKNHMPTRYQEFIVEHSELLKELVQK